MRGPRGGGKKVVSKVSRHTSAAENTGDLDELDGDLCGFHIDVCVCGGETGGCSGGMRQRFA